MLKVTLWRAPYGFTFDLKDSLFSGKLDSALSLEKIEKRYALRDGLIQVSVISEFTEIPIRVEFDRHGHESSDTSEWDRIVEVPIAITGNFIIFDDMEEFGRLELWPGNFRVRIHYGGQASRGWDGSSNDYYLLQIWPSNDKSEKILKS